MTRKDYVGLERAIRTGLDCLDSMRLDGTPLEVAERAVYWTAEEIAWRLHIDNPRFDGKHFLAVVRGEKPLESRPRRSIEATDKILDTIDAGLRNLKARS